MKAIKRDFSERFDMSDFGEATSILGIDIIRDWEKGTIILELQNYVDKIVSPFNMTDAQGRSIPMDVDREFFESIAPATDKERQRMAQPSYGQVVGSLMHGMIYTRPNLAYPLATCSSGHN